MMGPTSELGPMDPQILLEGNEHISAKAVQATLELIKEYTETDLKLATIYVMPLGGKDVKKVITALNDNKRFLRGEIAHRVNLKFAPDIRFRADERFDEAERIVKLLRTPEVKRDLENGGDDE